MNRFFLMDLDDANIGDLLVSAAKTLGTNGPMPGLTLQGLVDETTGGIVAYTLPGFDFELIRPIEWVENGTEVGPC